MTWLFVLLGLLGAVALYDLTQKAHAILRNFPVIGHFRYILETIGPELRQYIVTSNNEELPFTRDQRTWVYASAKKQNNYTGFGTHVVSNRHSNREAAPEFDTRRRVANARKSFRRSRLARIVSDGPSDHGSGALNVSCK